MRRLEIGVESKILSGYKKGLSPKTICKKYSIGNTTLYRILKRNNVNVRIRPIPDDKRFFVCLNCGKKSSSKNRSRKQIAQGVFCSEKCMGDYRKGTPTGRHPKSEFKKGITPWNKGKIWFEMSGKNNPNYKEKLDRECPSCGKKFKIHPYRALNVEDNYCSSRCVVLGNYAKHKFKFSNTKIERIIKKELEKMGLIEGKDFIHQYRFKGRSYDFAFPHERILIETHGDYFHVNPQKFDVWYDKDGKLITEGLHPKMQLDTLRRDKIKQELASGNGWLYVFYWESDIMDAHNLKVVVNSIKYLLSISKIGH